MVMTDPIADMLTRIRNASSVKHESVDVPRSSLRKSWLGSLRTRGSLESIKFWKMINKALSESI
jgi:small subunit ribosomal protein S8